MYLAQAMCQLPCRDLRLKRREIALALKEFIFYYEEREVGNIIKICKNYKDKNVPTMVWEWEGEAPEQIQGILFKIFPKCSPGYAPGYEFSVTLNFSLEEMGNIV